MKQVFRVVFILLLVSLIYFCGPKEVKVEPSVEEQGTVETRPLLDVPKDPSIYKACHVIKDYGKMTQMHRSYQDFLKASKGGKTAFTPAMFYDTYKLKLTEQNHRFQLMFSTARRAIKKDQRVEDQMSGLPRKVIDVNMTTPKGMVYMMSDNEADGVLDFATPANRKQAPTGGVDVQLLKRLQKKYAWVLSVVKKYYKKK